MKKSLLILAAVFAFTSTLAMAANKHDKPEPLPKDTHEMTVGNEKAAASGSVADNKTVKDEKVHDNEGQHKSKGHHKK